MNKILTKDGIKLINRKTKGVTLPKISTPENKTISKAEAEIPTLWSGIGLPMIGRRAILEEWLYQAPYGQPRGVDIRKLREIAETAFINICLTSIIDTFATTPWVVSPKKNVDNEEVAQKHAYELTEFLMKPNKNKETLTDLQRQWARDVLVIDAGVIVKVFDDESFEEEQPLIRMEKSYGRYNKFSPESKVKETKEVTAKLDKQYRPLKPIGKRKITEIYCRDGSKFLADGDPTGFVKGYFQYSWKFPRRAPSYFDRNEIVYTMKSPNSYSFYGWSPIQSIVAIVETLKAQVQYFETFFKEKAVPEGLISVKDANKIELERMMAYWSKHYKGRMHKIGAIGRDAKFVSLSATSKDMEMLASQQWFMKLVLAQFNLNVPILTLKGEAPRAGTESLTHSELETSVKPLLQQFAYEINAEVLSEFQYEDVEFKFESYNLEEDIKKRMMQINDAKAKIITVNEIRSERGLDPVDWGDEPLSIGMPMQMPFEPKMKFNEFKKKLG